MVEVNHFYPIAQWLESQEVASDLVINLSDPSDEKIYICEYGESEVSEEGIDRPFEIAFDSYWSMLDHIKTIRIRGEVIEAAD